jgi:hypothetical protein
MSYNMFNSPVGADTQGMTGRTNWDMTEDVFPHRRRGQMSAAAGSAVRNNNGKKKTIMKGTLRDVSSAQDIEHPEVAEETEMPTADKRIYSGTFDKKVSAIECLLCLAQSVTTMCPYSVLRVLLLVSCSPAHLFLDSQVQLTPELHITGDCGLGRSVAASPCSPDKANACLCVV